jgi:hypothetical protein
LCRNLRFSRVSHSSRTNLSVYRNYRAAVHAAIEEVNTRFGAPCGGEPIQVFYTNEALVATEQCGVLLVNSREDGMNLVVKEWAVANVKREICLTNEDYATVRAKSSECGAQADLIGGHVLERNGRAHFRFCEKAGTLLFRWRNESLVRVCLFGGRFCFICCTARGLAFFHRSRFLRMSGRTRL